MLGLGRNFANADRPVPGCLCDAYTLSYFYLNQQGGELHLNRSTVLGQSVMLLLSAPAVQPDLLDESLPRPFADLSTLPR